MARSGILDKTLRALRPLLPRRFRADIPVVPVVRLSGVIGFSTPLRPGLTLASVAKPLERAFAWPRARAVALLINSPGGSAVQSHLIFQRIRQLSAEKKVPVIAFVEEVAASGGYMIACAADEIFADPSSIVGSIGVIGATFGFNKLIEKIGVERRIYTSGVNKAMLDPFLPENPDHVARLTAIQEEIHATFISLVKSRRGGKLNGAEEDLFSGEYWAGLKGRELGLVDRIGDLRSTLRERYGEKVETPLVAAKSGWFGRTSPGIAGRFDALLDRPALTDELISSLEARAIWARYGL
ncbi:MAG: S49 family peptidase [Xanthobacteraceae bacterium]